jgi:hypothetical protein
VRKYEKRFSFSSFVLYKACFPLYVNLFTRTEKNLVRKCAIYLLQILHVSGSDVIKQRVKNAKVHILDRCGHAVVLDRPRKLIKTITQFLENVATT